MKFLLVDGAVGQVDNQSPDPGCLFGAASLLQCLGLRPVSATDMTVNFLTF